MFGQNVDMDFLKIILLGVVQGLTEFLPVSSSGHILLAQKLLGVTVDAVTVTLVLHLGTLVAVIAVFYKDFLRLFRPPFTKLFLLILATIPAGVAGLLLDDAAESLFAGKFLGFAFLFTAIILFVCNKLMKKDFDGDVTVKHAAAMGFMQAVALIPGVSRSGSTLFGGLVAKGEKKQVTSFAFLMSIPIILGGCAVKFAGGGVMQADVLLLIVGFVSAAVSGIFAIKLVLKLIGANNFLPFCIYLIVVAVVSFVVM